MSGSVCPASQIALKGDANTLIMSLRQAFTGHVNLIKELLQNGRRANSPRVEIIQDAAARTLEVIDYGCGISDFEDLLFIGRSGWDAATIEAENAFGVGLLMALNSCEHIDIRSKGRRLAAPTETILSFQPVSIEACEEPYTRVRLTGVRAYQEAELKNLVKGFPIPVFFNGTELPRPDALDARYSATAVGAVLLPTRTVTNEYRCYLQGFEIASSRGYWSEEAAVVHLDSRLFRARLPDRQVLIDADCQVKLVGAAIQRLWRSTLLSERTDGNTGRLLGFAAHLQELGCADLLNDVPVLPAALQTPVDLRNLVDANLYGAHEREGADLPQNAAEQATLILEDDFEALIGDWYPSHLSDHLDNADNPDFYNAVVYLRAAGAVRVRTGLLDAGHWVFRLPNLIKSVEISEAGLESPLGATTLDGRAVFGIKVRACGAAILSGNLGRYLIKDVPVIMAEEATEALAVGAEVNGTQLGCILSTYRDSHDQFDEGASDADAATFGDQLAVARGADPARLLEAALRAMHGDRALFAGRSFTVRFNKKAGLTVKARRPKRAAPR